MLANSFRPILFVVLLFCALAGYPSHGEIGRVRRGFRGKSVGSAPATREGAAGRRWQPW